jgi:hypothetical protein
LFQLGDTNAFNFNFYNVFLASAFLPFLLGGIAGWIANAAMHRQQNAEEE